MELNEDNVGAADGIPAWTCSLCGIMQRLESDPCRNCGHPRDKSPASDDIVIQNWHPNEGEDDNGEDDVEEQLEGMYEAPEAAVEVDSLRVEGEAQNPESDFSSEDDDDGDWEDTELVDADALPSVDDFMEIPPPQPEGPRGAEAGWLCSFCNHENSMIDLRCSGCQHLRNMGENADDIIMLRPEVTAGLRPNAIPDEKDIEEKFEVWQCPFCSSMNDWAGEVTPCWCCAQTIDTTVGGFITFSMGKQEYERDVRKVKEPAAGAGGGAAAGGAAGGRDGGARAASSWAAPFRNNNNSRKSFSVSNLRSQDDAFTNPPAVVRKHCATNQYPTRVDPAFKDPNRLGQVLGLPAPLANFSMPKLFFRDGVICYPCSLVQEAIEDHGPDGKNGLFDRGFAVNSRGLLAVLTRRRLRVYRPQGPSFAFVCEASFPYATEAQPHLVRVRFHNDIIYIFLNYTVYRFQLVSDQLVSMKSFGDDYMKEQSFQDIDVDDQHIVACWRKWAGLYSRNDFKWFHAVSTSTVLHPPRGLAYRHNYLHIMMGGCLFAFHAASRDPSVLWVNGNLPKKETPFCVSDTYGVFTAVNGDIVQSYYDAHNAQPIYKDECKTGSLSVTPTATRRIDRSRHFVHDRLAVGSGSPFERVSHIDWDASFGQTGRLLCWDQDASVLFMCLPRLEFDQLEALFRRVFGFNVSFRRAQEEKPGGILGVADQLQSLVRKALEDVVSPIEFLEPERIDALSCDDRVDFRCADGRFRPAVVRARGGNEFMILKIDGVEPETQRIVDVQSYIGKFAAESAISGRDRSRLQDVRIGMEVEVNLSNVGWNAATVNGVSAGQMEVQLGNGETRWTHADFVDEIREKKNLVAEAIAYADNPESVTAGEAAAENLIDRISPGDREEIETKFAEATARYSEMVVKFALNKALNLNVSSTPDGLRVTVA